MTWNKIKQKIKENTNSLIILGVVLVLVLSYLWFFPDLDDPIFTREERTEAEEVGRELVEELNRLRTLDRIDLAILESPIVNEMDDITRNIPFRATGRTNPFAPF